MLLSASRSVWSCLGPGLARVANCTCRNRLYAHDACAGEAPRATPKLSTPVPTVASEWSNQPPVADLAHFAARLERATPLTLPLRLNGIIVHTSTANECTVLAPLSAQGVDEYSFRVHVPTTVHTSTHALLHQEVTLSLVHDLQGSWVASDMTRRK